MLQRAAGDHAADGPLLPDADVRHAPQVRRRARRARRHRQDRDHQGN